MTARAAGRYQRGRMTPASLLRAAAIVVSLAATAGRADDGRRFVVETNPFVLGQAVDWLDPDHVVWHDPMTRDEDGDGQVQIYRSTLGGGEKACLTCGLAGPNQVPVVQPHGDWILFHSWNGHKDTIGAPGFGGIGSDVWAMRRDGTQRTNLTPDPELHDNFHAYWSPDGRWIVWTALDWNAADGGNGKSEIRVARFDPSGPRLVDVHAVRPGNGHWYETQWWAPDGSGFLYTETVDTAINPELFFCRLRRRERGECEAVRLTIDPGWDEQAIFTPDMQRIIFMSSRDLPGAQNDWATVASLLKLPPEYDYELILPVFAESYLQPILQQATDLWEMTLRWHPRRTHFKPGPLRRLTTSGEQGWVIPEFAWDPRGRRLLWTQNKYDDARRVDEGCVLRELRAAAIAQLDGVTTVDKVPFGLNGQLRAQIADLLRDPRTYPYRGACGGTAPDHQPALAQETRIGHFE